MANGVSAETANAIFDEIAVFADYAFNKSHAVSYAYLAYQTAYLKVHYFADDMAALLTSVMGDTTKTMEYLTACQNAGGKSPAASCQRKHGSICKVWRPHPVRLAGSKEPGAWLYPGNDGTAAERGKLH